MGRRGDPPPYVNTGVYLYIWNSYCLWILAAFDSGSAIPAVSESELFPLPSIPLAQPAGHMTDMSRLLNTNIYPPKSQIKRQKMIYRCKFGEFGILEGKSLECSAFIPLK